MNQPDSPLPAPADHAAAAGSRLAGTPAEIFARLLDESVACLAGPADLEIPDDDLHREILLPLLPAMLGDKAIRQHWRGQAATGFYARLVAHVETGAALPVWQPGDFEIHVTASYLAGPDAKALADTLLSEESLRDLTAALMNQVLGVARAKLPLAAPMPVPEILIPAAEPIAIEVAQPKPLVPVLLSEVEVAASEIEPAPEEEPAAALAPFPLSSVPSAQEEAEAMGRIERLLTKQNPIRGTHHTFGGLSDRGWLGRNPLKRHRV
jgi:hypothetical protein